MSLNNMIREALEEFDGKLLNVGNFSELGRLTLESDSLQTRDFEQLLKKKRKKTQSISIGFEKYTLEVPLVVSIFSPQSFIGYGSNSKETLMLPILDFNEAEGDQLLTTSLIYSSRKSNGKVIEEKGYGRFEEIVEGDRRNVIKLPYSSEDNLPGFSLRNPNENLQVAGLINLPK